MEKKYINAINDIQNIIINYELTESDKQLIVNYMKENNFNSVTEFYCSISDFTQYHDKNRKDYLVIPRIGVIIFK